MRFTSIVSKIQHFAFLTGHPTEEDWEEEFKELEDS